MEDESPYRYIGWSRMLWLSTSYRSELARHHESRMKFLTNLLLTAAAVQAHCPSSKSSLLTTKSNISRHLPATRHQRQARRKRLVCYAHDQECTKQVGCGERPKPRHPLLPV